MQTLSIILSLMSYTSEQAARFEVTGGKIVQEFNARPATLFYYMYKKESEGVVLWHQR